MPAATVPKNAIASGPGYLYVAPLATSLPANTVVGSVFTDNWPAGWNLIGVTKDGSEFDYQISTDNVESAEYFDPLIVVITARSASMKAEVIQFHATNLARALNGSSPSVSGSGSTQLNTVTPPTPGTEVRTMIGWEAQDNTERLVMEQVLQVGSLAVSRKKQSADTASLTLEFHAELPASGFPFRYWSAGTVRG